MLSFNPPFCGRYVVKPQRSLKEKSQSFEAIQIVNSFADQEELVKALLGEKNPGPWFNARSVDDYEKLKDFFHS